MQYNALVHARRQLNYCNSLRSVLGPAARYLQYYDSGTDGLYYAAAAGVAAS